jgi:translation initiation factor IF-2
MRVHELAKELNIGSKELIKGLNKLRVPVKGPMSVVDDETVTRIRQAMAALRPGASKKPSSSKPVAVVKAVAAKPKPAARAVEPVKPPMAKPAVSKPAVTPLPRPIVSAAKPAVAVVPPPPKPQLKAAPVAPPKPASVAAAVPAPVVVAAPEPVPAAPAAPRELIPLQMERPITVKELAMRCDVKANELIKYLIDQGVFAALTQQLDEATASTTATHFGFMLAPQPSFEERINVDLAPDPAKLVPRAPVVTFMGHVDHGKTSLLDAIRQSKVAEGEAGGITQHIGAHEVVLPKGRVTFLDTPGHEAFTALRARGANITDIVVLVVAADDGVMPQTVEAINHAKAAGVPIVVAINKMDKPDADPQKVQQQLTQYDLLSEAWGGKTIMAPVSARSGEGIDNLLELLLLEAELLELKADPTKPAQGTVIEAKVSKDRGPLATLLIQQGTLRLGDQVVIGTATGRVRALTDGRGHRVKEVKPGSPVEMLGMSHVPQPGDRFFVMNDEKQARQLIEQRQTRHSQRVAAPPKRVTLDDLHQRILEGRLKELKLILKADVQGSLEAVAQSLMKIDTQAVKLSILHTGVGDISESDVMLAAASDAVVIGFHIGMDPQVQVAAVTQGVDVRIFQIIYEVVNEIRASIEGLLEPKIEETFLGRAEIKQVFHISKVGQVAGCVVTKGTIRRDALLRLIRGKERVAEGKIATLKRHKDDAREVHEGTECGIALEGSVSYQPGDVLEAWDLKKVAQKLAS